MTDDDKSMLQREQAMQRVFAQECWEAFEKARESWRGCPCFQCAFCLELLLDAEHVRAHIFQCSKHPMRQVEKANDEVEAKNTWLRSLCRDAAPHVKKAAKKLKGEKGDYATDLAQALEGVGKSLKGTVVGFDVRYETKEDDDAHG